MINSMGASAKTLVVLILFFFFTCWCHIIKRCFRFPKLLNEFKILQKLFIIIFPKVSFLATGSAARVSPGDRRGSKLRLQLVVHPGFVQAERGSVVFCPGASASAQSHLHPCHGIIWRIPQPLRQEGEIKGLYWSGRCTAPCRAVLQRRSLKQEVIEKKKSSGAIADHLAPRGEIRPHFLIFVKDPEYRQSPT